MVVLVGCRFSLFIIGWCVLFASGRRVVSGLRLLEPGQSAWRGVAVVAPLLLFMGETDCG